MPTSIELFRKACLEKQKSVNLTQAALDQVIEEIHQETTQAEIKRDPASQLPYFSMSRHNQLLHNRFISVQNTLETIKTELSTLGQTMDMKAFVRILSEHSQSLSKFQASRDFLEAVFEKIEPTPLILNRSSAPFSPTMEAEQDGLPKRKDTHGYDDETLEQILIRKKLSPHLFKQKSRNVSLHSDLSAHVSWVFHAIYKIPYPTKDDHAPEAQSKIARYCHGIQHVTRATSYVPVLANLYRKYKHPEALALSDEDLQLLQIAVLFHDTAREDEGVDRWDHESGIFLYYYLTKMLGVDPGKSITIAEAMANKDWEPTKQPDSPGYFRIYHSESAQLVHWGFDKSYTTERTIYHKIIHDADCLDIIRARDSFNAEYLNFYQDIAIYHMNLPKSNENAFEIMSHLTTTVRRLIAKQGDTMRATRPHIKIQYENHQMYQHLLHDIDETSDPILYQLGQHLMSTAELEAVQLFDLTPYNPFMDLTELNFQRAMHAGKVFARGVNLPSRINVKQDRKETNAELELRKTMRAPGVPTRTKKTNSREKDGNSLRSVSMIGHSGSVFCSAGFLIVAPDINAIQGISTVDSNSGIGKKSHIKKYLGMSPIPQGAEKQLDILLTQIKKGGQTHFFSKDSFASHTEILYKITKFDAIYCSNDPNLLNRIHFPSKSGYPYHHALPFLEAVYLRQQYALQYEETKQAWLQTFPDNDDALRQFTQRFGRNAILPLFVYSALYDQAKLVKEEELDDEHLIGLWVDLCSDFLKSAIEQKTPLITLERLSLDDLKVFSMYGEKGIDWYGEWKPYAPLDSNYNKTLRSKIDQSILKARDKIFNELKRELLRQLLDGQVAICFPDDTLFTNIEVSSLFADNVFFAVIHDAAFKESIPASFIQEQLEKALAVPLFKGKNITHFFKKYQDKADYKDELFIIPTTLDELIKDTWAHQKVHFSDIAIRCQTLATLYKQDAVKEAIQNQAITAVWAAMIQITEALNEHCYFSSDPMNIIHRFSELIQLEQVIKSFELTNILEESLLSLKFRVFEEVIKFHAQNIYFSWLLERINNMQWISFDEAHPESNALFQSLTEQLLSSQADDGTLNSLVELGTLLNKDIKPIIMQFLRENPIWSNDWLDYGVFSRLLEKHPLNETNMDLFEALIHWNVSRETMLKDWPEKIAKLQLLVPNAIYSDTQRSMIEARWISLLNRFMNPVIERLQDPRPLENELILLANFLYQLQQIQTVNYPFNMPKELKTCLQLGLKRFIKEYNKNGEPQYLGCIGDKEFDASEVFTLTNAINAAFDKPDAEIHALITEYEKAPDQNEADDSPSLSI